MVFMIFHFLVEMFYWNTIEQFFLFVEQIGQLEVCLPYRRLLTGILREAIQKKREYIRTSDLKEGGGQFENLIFT